MLKHLFIFILLLNYFAIEAQELLYHTRTEIENRGINLFYTEIFSLFGDTYFTTQSAGYQRLKFGDEFLSGNRADTLYDYDRNDQFILKVDTAHQIIDYWVIDNCESYDDHTNTNQYSIILINVDDEEDADSLAIMTMPEGTEIPRKDHLNESLLIFTDTSMNFLEYRVPTTGRIFEIEGGSEVLYMGIEMREQDEFILVGSDTVWNYQNSLGGYSPTIVLAGYNFIKNEITWWNRLGSDWNDHILDFKIDEDENIYTLFYPGGQLNHYADTIEFGGGTPPHHNALLKVNAAGDFQWVQSFQGVEGEYLSRLYLDDDGNPYVLGIFYGQIIHLFDTIFTLSNHSDGRGLLVKFDQEGDFEWGFFLKGDYRHNSFTDLDISSKDSVIYLSGVVVGGNIELTGIIYEDSSTAEGTFISKVGQFDGKDLGHVWFEGTSNSTFYGVQIDEAGNLLTYMRFSGSKDFLGYHLQSLPTHSGFLLTLNTAWNLFVATKTPRNDLFNMYPNPIPQNGTVNLSLSLNTSSNLYIIDMRGFVVIGKRSITTDTYSMNLNGLPPGSYVMLVENGQDYQIESFIIQ